MIKTTLAAFVALAASAALVEAGTAQEWRTRTVYQVMTDRFAVANGAPYPGQCDGPQRLNYCGGTWNGIRDKLPYIKSMGFDAIWISPTVENTADGYHGYWAKNFYNVNDKFGTKEDLKGLVKAAHDQGIWVMVDVVANHLGPNDDVQTFPAPFNKWPDHFHPFQPITNDDYNRNDDKAIENKCIYDVRLDKMLPDLNTENPFVKNELNKWVNWLVKEFNFDGIRVDTVKHVPRSFWPDFARSSGVYAIGEAFQFDKTLLATYKDTMDGIFNFGFYDVSAKVFMSKQSMWNIETYLSDMRRLFGQDKLNLLGTFVDNHDLSRFLFTQPDRALLRNALAFALFTDGIPFVYQGTEQEYAGGADPENREPLWYVNYKNTTTTQFFAALNKVRATAGDAFHKSVHTSVWTKDNFHAFRRGPVLVALTNVGSQGQVTENIASPFPAGTVLVNALDSNDRVTVSGSTISITLRGEPKVYVAQNFNGARRVVKRNKTSV
ncbi:uncharacterized protein SPPG_05741 [Spizellomyces punctatus DAOM BR117]|uniref:Alpha-amylase n=1 Tax=Spizellomyces punctatus (strain DAOM BR117) TaxID=645134 RepID=A0A0L0HCV7_SPIPD|nr:uncharacterized protein SPPG_05741 [Spizellomyces punctatus DAOM BR117]KNC98759.1 hypothetical protein SPPG_05741 [Spizellomyces punctatus DAOM BR117]|eukprot:XP_016606799.1 hypothetical protein SPPG_05741 [Spizellomyces punctatus DAOM BR117]